MAKSLKEFDIPDNVRVIKRRAFYGTKIFDCLVIPSSVEVIEENTFFKSFIRNIEFAEGSRWKPLTSNAFYRPEDLIINNENFIKSENKVIMSKNPRGIYFVLMLIQILR